MADTEVPAAAPAAAPEVKKKRSKTLLIVVAAVVCLGLGAGYVVMSHKAIAGSKKASQQIKREAAPPVAVVSLESFVVNLADPSHNAFLRVSVSLGLSKALPASGDDASDLPIIPPVRDAILSVLTTWQSGDLLAPGGKAKLKAQLLSVLQQRVPKLGVTDVYFTDFLIQQ